MHSLKQIAASGILAFAAANGVRAETNGFECQAITLPAKAMTSRFADLDNHGRYGLLALDRVAKRLWIYRQRASGFTNAPDQVIELPPQTAWIAPFHVETNSGVELLMSTATGLVYYRQSGGIFESEPRTLIRADQVFTNDDSPSLISLATNAGIPVVSATQAWSYRRNERAEWKSEPPVALEATQNSWSGYRNTWTLGQNSSHSLDISRSLLASSEAIGDEKPENDGIAKLLADLKKAGPWNQPCIDRVDLNGDGRKDFILWQVLGEIDFKTDVNIFLRGAEGRLPERPTQVLHCRGFPIPIGNSVFPSLLGDLKGDGTYELVLLEPKLVIASASSLLDMALSRGVDMALTIRTFHRDAFSHSADAAVPLTALLSWYGTRQWPFIIQGDFNGDGRPDLVVQRTSDQWEILFSTDDGRWFKPQPAMKFEMPTQGYFEKRHFEIRDLNGDGRSDIVLRDVDDPRIFIFLTQPPHTKGSP